MEVDQDKECGINGRLLSCEREKEELDILVLNYMYTAQKSLYHHQSTFSLLLDIVPKTRATGLIVISTRMKIALLCYLVWTTLKCCGNSGTNNRLSLGEPPFVRPTKFRGAPQSSGSAHPGGTPGPAF